MKKTYVAYGSNLNLEQMAFRCPDAKVLYVGKLINWKLVFRGSKTGSYATVIRSKGDMVPVVIWEISESDELNLDRYEGYPRFYYKKKVMIQTDIGKKKAMIYIMNDMAIPGRPSALYIKGIMAGYKTHGLPLAFLYDALAFNAHECA